MLVPSPKIDDDLRATEPRNGIVEYDRLISDNGAGRDLLGH
jgi:hypothetical protein